jgi:hypothetical protein
MADVLRACDGMVQTEKPEEADVILFNTCSIREKAEEKVFSDLGRVRTLKLANPNLLIGVGGCVASQEGAAILQRAPYVDVVFGPQTLHRLPQLLQARRETGRSQVDISFPEIEKFDHLPTPVLSLSKRPGPSQAEGAQASPGMAASAGSGQAYVSIMEGCSKYCTYCVVPYTRGEEVSRPLADVMRDVEDLVAQGVKEITLLGERQRLPALAGWTRWISLSAAVHRRAGWHRAAALHHLASQGNDATADRSIRDHAQAGQPFASAGAVGLGSYSGGDETRSHRTRIQIHHSPGARGASRYLHHLGFHRWIPGRDRTRLRGHDETDR